MNARSILLSAFAGLACVAQPAAAVSTLSQTVAIPLTDAGDSSSLSFAKFDTNLGSLTGVSLRFNATSYTELDIANNTNSFRLWQITPSSTATLSGNGFNLSATDSDHTSLILLWPRFGPGSPRTSSFGFNGQYADSDSLSTGFGAFTGPGSVAFTFSALNQWAVVGSGGPHGFSKDAYKGEATIEYSYDGVEILPEPQSWAMLIAGFGLVGASLRRRRAARA